MNTKPDIMKKTGVYNIYVKYKRPDTTQRASDVGTTLKCS